MQRDRSALDRWLRLEAGAAGEAPLEAVDASLVAALRALPVFAPAAGFSRRVVARIAPELLAPRRLPWWARLTVAASLGLAGSALLTAGAWGSWLGAWLRPGELIDGAGFALRQGAFIFVHGLSTWQALADVRDALLRVLATPDAAGAVSAAALAAFIAFHALRGVLVSERSAHRV